MPVNFYAPPLAPHGCFMMDTIKFYVCARRYSREQMSGDYHDVFLIRSFWSSLSSGSWRNQNCFMTFAKLMLLIESVDYFE